MFSPPLFAPEIPGDAMKVAVSARGGWQPAGTRYNNPVGITYRYREDKRAEQFWIVDSGDDAIITAEFGYGWQHTEFSLLTALASGNADPKDITATDDGRLVVLNKKSSANKLFFYDSDTGKALSNEDLASANSAPEALGVVQWKNEQRILVADSGSGRKAFLYDMTGTPDATDADFTMNSANTNPFAVTASTWHFNRGVDQFRVQPVIVVWDSGGTSSTTGTIFVYLTRDYPATTDSDGKVVAKAPAGSLLTSRKFTKAKAAEAVSSVCERWGKEVQTVTPDERNGEGGNGQLNPDHTFVYTSTTDASLRDMPLAGTLGNSPPLAPIWIYSDLVYRMASHLVAKTAGELTVDTVGGKGRKVYASAYERVPLYATGVTAGSPGDLYVFFPVNEGT